MTKQRIAFAIFFILLVIGFVAAFRFLFSPLILDEQGYPYTVHPGEKIQSVIDDLYFKNIIKNRLFFRILVDLRGGGYDLKAGEYLFPAGANAYKILTQLLTGSGLVYHEFSIIPGWNMRQLRAALLQERHFKHTSQNFSDSALMNYLGQPGVSPEGQFYPDTYYFASGTDDLSLLKRAFKAMQAKLAIAWASHDLDLPFKNSYEALIVASMVEKETEFDSERPVIVGVIINRLHKNMRLQIDPTVIYGLGTRFDGTIYKENLREDTPYNTYTRLGLPPTPISMPSEESIMAAVHPEHHDYLFFVARRGKDGPHQFSKTLAEHNIAVAISKKLRGQFFNNTLIRYYLLKLFSERVIEFPLPREL
jgi:UPF0755 protein